MNSNKTFGRPILKLADRSKGEDEEKEKTGFVTIDHGRDSEYVMKINS